MEVDHLQWQPAPTGPVRSAPTNRRLGLGKTILPCLVPIQHMFEGLGGGVSSTTRPWRCVILEPQAGSAPGDVPDVASGFAKSMGHPFNGGQVQVNVSHSIRAGLGVFDNGASRKKSASP